MRIRTATRADLSSLADLISRAMIEDELCLWLMPEQASKVTLFRERCLHLTKRRFNAGYFIIVMELEPDDADWKGTPQIVGYAAYEKCIGAQDDSQEQAKSFWLRLETFLHSLEDTYSWYFRNYMDTNKARFAQLNASLANNQDLYRYPRSWELSILAVDPGFGRRGIGSRLIAWGKEKATVDGVPLWLWASRKGAGLYVREGFVEFCRVEHGNGVGAAPAMVWMPAGVSETS